MYVVLGVCGGHDAHLVPGLYPSHTGHSTPGKLLQVGQPTSQPAVFGFRFGRYFLPYPR